MSFKYELRRYERNIPGPLRLVCHGLSLVAGCSLMQELWGVRVSRDPSQHPIDAKAHLVQVTLACTVHYLQHMHPQDMSKSLSHNLNASSSRKSQMGGTEEEKHMMRSFEIQNILLIIERCEDKEEIALKPTWHSRSSIQSNNRPIQHRIRYRVHN